MMIASGIDNVHMAACAAEHVTAYVLAAWRPLSAHQALGRPSKGKPALGSSEPFQGKFTWRIDNFTRLKDLLKKRKITGLCIKSKRFQVGGRDCRLIVYPRGQSQPPNHLSMFLEVTDSRTVAGDWSCFVSHRLAVVNQRVDDRSVSKESQNRYSKVWVQGMMHAAHRG